MCFYHSNPLKYMEDLGILDNEIEYKNRCHHGNDKNCHTFDNQIIDLYN